jgi:hypothetical protein
MHAPRSLFGRRFSQAFEIKAAVDVAKEAPSAIVAALDYMLRNTDKL